MKKLLSTNYSDGAFNIVTFILRTTLGVLMFFNHGYSKILNFSEQSQIFPDPFHIGHRWSLILSLFAESIASLLLVLGLFSRIAAFILVVNFSVIVFMVNRAQPIKQIELPIIFLAGFVAVLLVGPGKYSIDGMSGK